VTRDPRDPNALLDQIIRVLGRESAPATQAALALRLGRRYGDRTLALALARGLRVGQLALDMRGVRWSLATASSGA
jgi:hypothetical protein